MTTVEPLTIHSQVSSFLSLLKDDLYFGTTNFDFEDIESVCEEVAYQLQRLYDEYQELLDNMPEQQQKTDVGIKLQEQVGALEKAIDAILSYEAPDEPKWSEIYDDWKTLEEDDKEEFKGYWKHEQTIDFAHFLYSSLPDI